MARQLDRVFSIGQCAQSDTLHVCPVREGIASCPGIDLGSGFVVDLVVRFVGAMATWHVSVQHDIEAGARLDEVSNNQLEEARWRSLFEHSLDGVLLTAPDGRILAANPAACAMLGRTERDVCDAGRAGIVVVDDAALRFLDQRQREGHARGILTLRRKDGSTFLADLTSAIFKSASGALRTSMTFRDVTESERGRRVLEILADAGRVLASSLDESTTLKNLTDLVVPKLADVCVVDLLTPDGVARVATAHRNPSRVAEFVQVRRRGMLPHATAGVDYVLRTGEPSCVFELSDAWLHANTVDATHFEAARKLGVRSFVAVPLVAGGRTLGALTVMSDGGVPPFGEADLSLVRALGVRAATAIDNAHRHAESLDARRLRDEVLGVVAHDLRSPLHTIQLAATLLARRTPSTELETIQRAVQRADMLIHDLLLAAKAEGGRIPLVPRTENLASILDEVDAIHRTLAESKPLELVVTTEGTAPSAVVDRHRIVQMLSNLTANAIKFSPPGGRVEVRARADAERVVFTVSDTGIGIAADDIPHVFDRYWQGRHSPDLGAGLGLSICRGIAESHGGHISVASTVGTGTTFEVVLPASPSAPSLAIEA